MQEWQACAMCKLPLFLIESQEGFRAKLFGNRDMKKVHATNDQV